MRFNPKARIDEGQIDDRTGSGGGFGGGGLQLPIPSGGGGRIGMGTVVVVVLFLLFSLFTGNSPFGGSSSSSGTQSGASQCLTGGDANNNTSCAIDLVTNSVQAYWRTELPKESGKQYVPIKTVRFTGQTSSGCGTAAAQTGPFYCPNDQRVYIDQSFMRDMLQGQLGAKGGPFALGYVLAHEYGHHIEDQLGILGRMRTQRGPRSDSVRAELMADCLGGMWARGASSTRDAQGNAFIEGLTRQDVADAIDAALAVGDDRIQHETSGRVNPEQWTHGSSAEREKWFTIGYNRHSVQACNTFRTDNL
jgi:predicted metalloprotease